MNRNDVVAVAVAGLVYLFLAAPSFTARPVADEASFVIQATETVESGFPMVVWHPPTYVYYLAGVAGSVGTDPVVLRGATALLTLATIPVVYALARAVLGTADGELVGESWHRRPWLFSTVAVLLYVSAPLAVQNGTLLDIDGSVLALATTLVFYWVVRTDGKFDLRGYALLALAFAGLAWIKFGPLPAVFGAVVGYLALTGRYRESASAAASMAAGAAVFVGTWWLATAATPLSFLEPFRLNFGRWVFGGAQKTTAAPTQRVLTMGWVLFVETLWLSPFAILLAALPLAWLRRQWRSALTLRLSPRRPSLLIAGFVALTILEYAVLVKLPFRFPKYMGPTVPLLAVLVALAVAQRLPAPTAAPRGWTALCAGAGTVLVLTVLFPDPLRSPFAEATAPLVEYAVRVTGQYVLLAAVAVGVIALVFRVEPLAFDLSRETALTCVLLVLVVGSGTGILLTQVTADYGTRYYYGEEGRERVVGSVATAAATACGPDPTIAASKEFPLYTDSVTYDQVDNYPANATRLDADGPILLVLHRSDEAVMPVYNESLRRADRYEAQTVGSFVLYHRSGSRQCPVGA